VDLNFFLFLDKKSKRHSSKCSATDNVGLCQLSFAQYFNDVERVRECHEIVTVDVVLCCRLRHSCYCAPLIFFNVKVAGTYSNCCGLEGSHNRVLQMYAPWFPRSFCVIWAGNDISELCILLIYHWQTNTHICIKFWLVVIFKICRYINRISFSWFKVSGIPCCGIFAESQGTFLGNGTTYVYPQQWWRHSTIKQLWEVVFSMGSDTSRTLCHTHQQSNCKKKCFLWGPPRCCIRRANGSSELVRRVWRFWVGLQAGGPGPWLGGYGHSSTVWSRRLVSAVRMLQGCEEYLLLEDCNQATTSGGCSKLRRLVWVIVTCNSEL
jgi:hypothetical protein